MYRILLEWFHGNNSKRDEERATALHIAAKEGHLDYLNMCFASLGSAELNLAYGTHSDINVIMSKALSDVDRRGANILHYAVESENPDLVKVTYIKITGHLKIESI